MIEWNQDDFQESDSEKGMTTFEGQTTGVQQGYEHGSVQEGLVAYYPFEKGEFTTAYDSALDNNGTINGATWTTSTNIGTYALSFDGTNDSVKAIGTNLDTTNPPWTISTWIRRDGSFGSSEKFFGQSPSDGSYQDGLIDIRFADSGQTTPNALYISVGGSFTGHIGSTPVTDSLWHHVVVTFDGSTYTGFLDGSFDGSISGSAPSNVSADPIWLGANYNEYSEVTMNGFRFYDRALSQPEVEALSALTSPSGTVSAEDPRTGIVSEYKLDGDATDSVGTADGTNNGVTFVNGYDGQAGEFNGTDQHIDTPISSLTTPWTISTWINADAFSAESGAVCVYSMYSGGSNDFYLWINTNNGGIGWADDTSTDIYANQLNEETNTWYNVVWVRSNSETIGYINGARINSASASSNTFDANDFRIGAFGDGTRHWDGNIDEVRIYNQALEPYEVEQLYELGRLKIDEKYTL